MKQLGRRYAYALPAKNSHSGASYATFATTAQDDVCRSGVYPNLTVKNTPPRLLTNFDIEFEF